MGSESMNESIDLEHGWKAYPLKNRIFPVTLTSLPPSLLREKIKIMSFRVGRS